VQRDRVECRRPVRQEHEQPHKFLELFKHGREPTNVLLKLIAQRLVFSDRPQRGRWNLTIAKAISDAIHRTGW
jgi:hypothetical protein